MCDPGCDKHWPDAGVLKVPRCRLLLVTGVCILYPCLTWLVPTVWRGQGTPHQALGGPSGIYSLGRGGGGVLSRKNSVWLLRSVVVTSRYFWKGNLRGEFSSQYILIYVFPHRSIMKVIVYYPPEGRRGKYWGGELFCCNASFSSKYENYRIIIA